MNILKTPQQKLLEEAGMVPVLSRHVEDAAAVANARGPGMYA